MKTIRIYPCGTDVQIKNAAVNGTITATSIRFNSISYEISYFIGSEQKVLWMNEKEFSVEPNTNKIKIGFK
jgi:hypothetical protein